LLLKLILIFPNSCQVGSLSKVNRGKANGPLYLICDYIENIGKTIFRVNEKHMTVHILFLFLFHNAVWCEKYDLLSEDPVQSVHQWAHEDCTTYRGFGSYFWDDCRNWFWFFNFIFIVPRVIIYFTQGGKWFLFFWLKIHLNVQVF